MLLEKSEYSEASSFKLTALTDGWTTERWEDGEAGMQVRVMTN